MKSESDQGMLMSIEDIKNSIAHELHIRSIRGAEWRGTLRADEVSLLNILELIDAGVIVSNWSGRVSEYVINSLELQDIVSPGLFEDFKLVVRMYRCD